MDATVYKNHKNLRIGYTTGTCAACAAKAAAYMLLTGDPVAEASVATPGGITVRADILDISKDGNFVRCAVRKDAGDDPDVTDGALIYAKAVKRADPGIFIDGGEGVGRVSLPGLSCAVGQAAINRVPRQMIESEVRKACRRFGYHGGIGIEISVPGGDEIAKKTFNPRLGILGGISILGTSGIVEPMSEKALVETIKLEINMQRASGAAYIAVTPGNYGAEFVKMHIGLNASKCVKCSNFVGETIDCAAQTGMRGILMIGHFGKFVKLAGGVMNTHSSYADCRMEIIAAHAASAGCCADMIKRILRCITVDEALGILHESGSLQAVLDTLMERIDMYLKLRAGEKLQIGAITFTNQYGILGQTGEASDLLEKIKGAEK